MSIYPKQVWDIADENFLNSKWKFVNFSVFRALKTILLVHVVSSHVQHWSWGQWGF